MGETETKAPAKAKAESHTLDSLAKRIEKLEQAVKTGDAVEAAKALG